jgi:hypothetical protein
LWGDPDSKTFVHDYIVYVTFMGARIPWHKWAVIPLMAVQDDILAAATGYAFRDVQTYNNRNIAGTNTKSNHAWAVAVDINPAQNPQNGSHHDMPAAVVTAFRAHGFKWGGDYRDWMHFEYLGLPVKEQGDDDVNDLQDKLLKLARVSDVARSSDMEIIKALIAGDKTKAAILEAQKVTAVAAEKARLGI